MSLLSLFGYSQPMQALAPNPSSDVWYEPMGLKTAAGVRVDEMISLTYSACWAATMLLSSSESMIPLKLFRRLPGGGSEPATDDPRYSLVHDSPNPDMTSAMFRSSRTAQQINWGNSFAEIGRTEGGTAFALYPIHASRIPKDYNIKRGPDGRLRYLVNNENGTKRELKDFEVLHIPSPMSEDGIIGMGVVEKARLSIAMGLATETQGAAYFGNSARPKLVIEGTRFKTKEDKEEFLRQWVATHGAPENNARPALTPEGAKVTALQFSAEDSQFLETRQFNVEEIARWYGVPPHMIQNLLRSTNNNITQQALEFVKYSLMRWLVPFEQELNKKLLTPEERKTMFFMHVVEGLERADITTRTAALHQQWFDGEITLNEWRALENRNPIGPLGDIHWTQQAMVPLEIAAKGPQTNAPQPFNEQSDEESEEIEEMRTQLAEVRGQVSDVMASTAVLAQSVERVVAAVDSLQSNSLRIETTISDSQDALKELATVVETNNATTIAATESQAAASGERHAEILARLDEASDKNAAVQRKLSQALVRDVLARLMSVEVHNVKNIAQSASKFDQRLAAFYDKHRRTMEVALLSPVGAVLAAHGQSDESTGKVREYIDGHVVASTEQLLSLCDCQADELPSRVEECVSKWHEERTTISIGG